MKKVFLLVLFCFFSLSLYSQKVMTPEIMWSLKRISEVQISPDGSKILYGVSTYDIKENKGTRNLYVMSSNGGTPVQITKMKGSVYNAIWRPDGKKIGFIFNGKIYEVTSDGLGEPVAITTEMEDINGFNYSPDLKHILIDRRIKLDKDIHDIHPDLPKANAYIFDDLMYRHWDSWTDFSYNHIFIADYKDGLIGIMADIMDGQKYNCPVPTDGGMEQINWSPEGNRIAYVSKHINSGVEDSKSTNTDIFIYDLRTSQTINISDGMLGYDMDPIFSPDGKKIVWNSMKTPGFESDKKRIIVYDFNTNTSKDYSENFDQSSTNFNWSKDGNEIYFISGINATFPVYKLNLINQDIKKITDGWFDYRELVYANDVLIGAKMSMGMPVEIFSINKSTGMETKLTKENDEILKGLNLAKIEQRWVNTTDNKKMLVWVIYPPNFDVSKKYPALLYCQGGPQSAVSQFFSYRWNFQMMAANDYIIVAPNRRGLPTFGQEWNDEISKDYGGQNMLDYFSAIDSISNLPFVDKNRLGAVGASYGGFSVYWLAGNHKGRFKAFIAHCGMFNFESWYGSTEEMWFANYDLGGAYYDNPKPKSYEFSPHKFIGNWDTPLLVITGGYDFRIPYTEGMQAFNSAQLKGIPSRFIFFPDESHFVSKPQNSILWQREFFKWLDKWLK